MLAVREKRLEHFNIFCSYLGRREDKAGKEENAALIRRILHTIKGEAGIVGLDEMYELSHQAEDAFDELPEDKRTDVIFRFKDWTSIAMQKLATTSV